MPKIPPDPGDISLRKSSTSDRSKCSRRVAERSKGHGQSIKERQISTQAHNLKGKKSERKRRIAWGQQPIVVSGSLMSLKLWDWSGRAEDVCFKTIPLWIHLLDIPALLRSEELIKQIAEHNFVSLHSIDPAGLERNRWSRMVRMFAEIRAGDPLLTNCELQTVDGTTFKIPFKYERIQPLCLYCGRLGHLLEACIRRRADMEVGMSGRPSGEYKPSLKVGVYSNTSSEEEEEAAGYEPHLLLRNIGLSLSGSTSGKDGASYSGSSAHGNEFIQHKGQLTLSDSQSRTNSPEVVQPQLQYLFPDPNVKKHGKSPIHPMNLLSSFEIEATTTNLYLSPMSPFSSRVPPGFEGRALTFGEQELQAVAGDTPIQSQFFGTRDGVRSQTTHMALENYGTEGLLGETRGQEAAASSLFSFDSIPGMDLNLSLTESPNTGKENALGFDPNMWSPINRLLSPVFPGLQSEGTDQLVWTAAQVLASDDTPFRAPGPMPTTKPLFEIGTVAEKEGRQNNISLGQPSIHSPTQQWGPNFSNYWHEAQAHLETITHEKSASNEVEETRVMNKDWSPAALVREGIRSFKKRKTESARPEVNYELNLGSLSISPTTKEGNRARICRKTKSLNEDVRGSPYKRGINDKGGSSKKIQEESVATPKPPRRP